MNQKIKTSLVILALALSTGCQKYVALDLPTTMAQQETVFAQNETATAAVLGLYTTVIATNLSLLNGGATLYPSLSADEVTNTAPNEELDGFRTASISPAGTLGIQTRLWSRAYSIIYHANAVIEGLEASTLLSTATRNQLLGEAKTIRALCYFYAVNLFGDIPLVTSTDFRVNEQKERTPAAQVWSQIRSDLEESALLLSPTYTGSSRGRINKWAAMALLARVYLYLEQWDKAEAAATAVISSGGYSLAENPSLVFIPTSSETILQWVREGSNTADGASFIPSSATAKPPFALLPGLLTAFEGGDNRRTAWTKSTTSGGVTYYYPFKYKVRSGATVQEYLVVLRLGEQYLIRGEARAKSGNLKGAADDLSLIRKRAGLGDVQFTSAEPLLEAIDKERRVELFAEWGHRWLDLKRRGKAGAVLAPIKNPNWQESDALYPLPLQELQRNPQLVQNPGY